MNLFFYENTPSAETEQFLELLHSRRSLQRLRLLPVECKDMAGHSLAARSGDILILFAATDTELTDLLESHEMFSDFQIILILKDHSIPNIISSYILKPRFITFTDSDTHNLEQVIQKIEKNTANNPYFLQA